MQDTLMRMGRDLGELTGKVDALACSVDRLRAENAQQHADIRDEMLGRFERAEKRLDKLNNLESRRAGIADWFREKIPWCIALAAIAVSYYVGAH